MLNTQLKSSLVAISIASVLSACGGGGGSAPAGSATNVTSSGTVTQFGSVFVNGKRYETTSARIVSDDSGDTLLENPTNAQLQSVIGLGNVVRVSGSLIDDSNGTANTIFIDNELVGDITSVSNADASFVVLGQTISVTPDTIIDDSIIETLRGVQIPNDLRFADLNAGETLELLLPAGLTVEVSGFPTQNGLEATRIEDVIASGGTTGGTIGGGFSGEAEIKGFVENLSGNSFQINGLTVNFDASDLDSEDFASTSLSNGQFVEVHGSASGTTLDASRIELENSLFDDNSSSSSSGEIEIEGVISNIVPDGNGGGDVTINGITITVNDISQFSEGLRIEIKGVLQSDGSVQITRLKDEEEDTIRTEDLVVSADADSFITRLGLDIAPTDRSRLEDDTISNDDNLSISAFLGNVNNQRVEARGFPLNGTTAWTRLEIEDSNDQRCRLRGPVANINGTASFTIEGITIDVVGVSDNNFEDANDLPIGRQAFFNQLSDGDIVQASSDSAGVGCTTGQLTAREVEFEPENNVIFSGGGSGDGINDNELTGTVSNVTATGFDIAGQTVSVNDSTVIDDSIIEDFRGVELPADLPFGDVPEALTDLLIDGTAYQVQVNRSNGIVATSIEDL